MSVLNDRFSLWKNEYMLIIRISIRYEPMQFPEVFMMLSVLLVPGEFYQILSWPFKDKVCLTLINKQNSAKDKRMNIPSVFDFGEEKTNP